MEQEIINKIQVLTDLVARARLSGVLGAQYGGDRELYKVLGYKEELTYSDYWQQYSRQDIAAAIIDKPIDATWRGSISIEENTEAENTPLEKAWDDICNDLQIKAKLISLDKLTCIGRYGVLFMGLSDTVTKEQLLLPPKSGVKLNYIKVFSESQAEIYKLETDPFNPRYGQPVIYVLKFQEDENGTVNEFRVHYTRVIHIVRSSLNNDIYGTPVLQKVFNRLVDLEKLTGGSAEMFWRGARPGYAGKLDEGFSLSPNDEDALLKQLDEYEHNLRRIFINRGISMEPMSPQVSDPSSHVNIQIQMISAQTGIPKRILTGSERGELSSSQDTDQWKETIQSRREEYAEQVVLRPFIDKLIAYGVLPAPKEKNQYGIRWVDLYAIGDKERAEIGKIRSEALRQYASQPGAEFIVPPDAFLEYFLGLSGDEIALINTMKDDMMIEEGADIGDDEGEGEGIATPTPETGIEE